MWFNRARHADNPTIAAEASKAFHNLRGDPVPQTTIWAMPMFSTRWHDVFSYGQIKHTFPMPWLGVADHLVSFYLSTRFDGDLKGNVPTQFLAPQYLSTSSLIFAGGVSTKTWHHFTGWAEAGESINYLPSRHDVGRATPDYRGGLNFSKGFGQLLGGKSTGMFYETTGDAVYISRFDKDWLFYSQHRAGETLHFGNGFSGQLLFNANYTRDVKGEYWANTFEVGPGIRLHAPWMPPAMYVSVDTLHGFYTMASPKPNYNDVRVSIWYAVTKTTPR